MYNKNILFSTNKPTRVTKIKECIEYYGYVYLYIGPKAALQNNV